jgi:hypothetical protein
MPLSHLCGQVIKAYFTRVSFSSSFFVSLSFSVVKIDRFFRWIARVQLMQQQQPDALVCL